MEFLNCLWFVSVTCHIVLLLLYAFLIVPERVWIQVTEDFVFVFSNEGVLFKIG